MEQAEEIGVVKIRILGHDGQPPEFMPVRDLDGKDKRAIDGIVNVNVDRLEWLLAHKKIDHAQHAAGRKLQGYNEQAQLMGYATLEGGRNGSGTNRLSDVKCDAIAAVNAARTAMGNSGWRIIELVVLENVSLGKAEARMRIGTGAGHGALTVALDALARHYGLA